MLATAVTSGTPIAGYHSEYSPGTDAYRCSTHELTTTGINGVQTDTWSRP